MKYDRCVKVFRAIKKYMCNLYLCVLEDRRNKVHMSNESFILNNLISIMQDDEFTSLGDILFYKGRLSYESILRERKSIYELFKQIVKIEDYVYGTNEITDMIKRVSYVEKSKTI